MSLGCLSLKYWMRMTTMPLAGGSNPCHTRNLTRTVKRTVGRVPTALVYAVGHEGTHELSPKRKQPYSYASARAKFKGSTAIVTIASVWFPCLQGRATDETTVRHFYQYNREKHFSSWYSTCRKHCLLCLLSAQCILRSRHYSPLNKVVLPFLLYEYKDQSLVKRMWMIFSFYS